MTFFFNTAWKSPWGSCREPPPPPTRDLVVVVLPVGPFPVSSLLLNFYLLFLMPHRKKGKKRRGKRSHVRSTEAAARRKAARLAVFKERLRGVVARVPVRRVPLGNGRRPYVQSAATEMVGSDILGRAAADIIRRLGGIAGQRMTAEGSGKVKELGRHTCREACLVVVGGARVVITYTTWNGGCPCVVPYLWVRGPWPLVVRVAHMFRA